MPRSIFRTEDDEALPVERRVPGVAIPPRTPGAICEDGYKGFSSFERALSSMRIRLLRASRLSKVNTAAVM